MDKKTMNRRESDGVNELVSFKYGNNHTCKEIVNSPGFQVHSSYGYIRASPDAFGRKGSILTDIVGDKCPIVHAIFKNMIQPWLSKKGCCLRLYSMKNTIHTDLLLHVQQSLDQKLSITTIDGNIIKQHIYTNAFRSVSIFWHSMLRQSIILIYGRWWLVSEWTWRRQIWWLQSTWFVKDEKWLIRIGMVEQYTYCIAWLFFISLMLEIKTAS